jgi:ERCC4-type nuclease
MIDTYEPNTIKLGLGDLCFVTPLETGDYVWLGSDAKTYAIERKEAGDFVSSLHSGRLPDQLSRLVSAYDVPILMTEGNFNSNHDGLVLIPGKNGHLINKHIPFMDLQKVLLEFQMAGVNHLHTNNIQATIRLIKGLYEWSQKPEHSLLNNRSRVNTINGRADDPLWVLMGLPGIGINLARPLMEMFGSPMAVFQAFANPHLHSLIKEIRGISQGKIDQVREVILPNVNAGRNINGSD